MNIAVVGAQWGDEGKGKLIDFLCKDMDVIVRYQGGNNAGHTVVVGKNEYVFHLLPSAILHKDKVCVIGNGVVIDPKALLAELQALEKRNIRPTPKQLKISGHAHVVMPYHRILDGLRESKRKNKIGTTGRGIGPCYADKVARCGIRVIDLLNPRILKAKLEDNLVEKNEVFEKVYGHSNFPFGDVYNEYLEYGERIRGFVCDTALYVNAQIEKKKKVLFEGAQGTFLDIDFGTYPFVTSSNTVVGGACVGSGVPPARIHKVVAAVKAYTTRVGEGPFPTEFSSAMEHDIRTKGHEFGATTGRPRRCGWFDAVMVRYAAVINGFSELAIMKLDVLDDLPAIKICTGYQYGGKVHHDFPMDFEALSEATPVYEELKGWQSSTRGVCRFAALPPNARKYIKRLEQILKVGIKYVSTGSKRDEMVVR
ncbi:MAG: adenylosuccinate synthase [Candidatus Omnitrophota bacterium]|nr:adenylosuccinate synthase [Candidatus Omnitrophota bacterium]MDZ4242489.1 adenylosuccinate synthase [Candidatus Omnitrophota bacterium]